MITLARLEKLVPGNTFTVNHLYDSSGREVSLPSRLKKLNLISFWTSWCGPCRREHPELLKIYNKYGGKDFNIISISFDENEELWKKSTGQDHISWANLIDTTGFKGETATAYKLNYVPFNVLLDERGRVIQVNITSEELRRLLSKSL